MNNLISVDQVKTMAQAVVSSGLFGMKTEAQATALMLIAQAEGYHPALAARDYHIIQGRPTLKAETMMARFQQQGGKVEWKTLTDQEVTATFSHPSGGSATITWTFEQAKKANLTGKDNWKNYPRAMLRARVVSEGIRTVFPGVVLGVYTPEEMQDIPTHAQHKDMGAAVVVEAPEPKISQEHPYNIYKGDGEVYQSFADMDGYIDGMRDLIGRINGSNMFEEVKKEKIQRLMEFNTAGIEALPTIFNLRMKQVLRDSGAIAPKPVEPPQILEEGVDFL
jgi:hypothetical protein